MQRDIDPREDKIKLLELERRGMRERKKGRREGREEYKMTVMIQIIKTEKQRTGTYITEGVNE